MITRNLGGEAGARGLFGGSVNRPRAAGLVVIFVVGLFLTLYGHLPGLLVSLAGGGVVVLLTAQTHHGSVWNRFQRRLWWRERVRRGLLDFRPLAERRDDLDPRFARRGADRSPSHCGLERVPGFP